jgi:hypothetical protein
LSGERLRSRCRSLLGLVVHAAVFGALHGQTSTTGPPSTTPPSTTLAVRLADEIRLDGRLDDPAWFTADSVTQLVQREPREGMPSTERTVVRVLRTRTALFVGVRADDQSAALIRASQLRRDADLTVDDYVTLLLDSFHDRRGAFLFRTNPNGAMWDAQLEGFDDLNENWNGIWDVAVTRDSTGWTAEFRVPFQTLRFHGGGATLGFNVERFIRRKNEEALWRSFGRTQGLLQLTEEGELAELGGASRGHGLELYPYALARGNADDHDASGTSLGGGGASVKAGLDAKLAVSPTLTADLTVNTDFAQVEADSQVINLTRFPVFFPEKREFFLESSGIFDFGTAERAQVFYSRRIGLRDNVPVPILGGGRLYGKAGPWTVGVLDARTGSGDEMNNLAVRFKHDLFERSSLGAVATLRTGPGVSGGDWTAGVDGQFPLVVRAQNVVPAFWIAGTHAADQDGTPLAWRLSTDLPNDLFDNFISLYHIDAGFSPALGFVRRAGIWETTGHVDFMPRPHLLGIRQLDFEVPDWDIIAGEGGSLVRPASWETAQLEVRPLAATFESGASLAVSLQRFLDAPADSFEVFRGASVAPGRYWWTRGEVQVTSSPAHALSVSSLLGLGGFYDGTNAEATLGATWRHGGHLTLGAEMAAGAVRLPLSRFHPLQASARAEYAFNTRTSFQGFVQVNNEDQRIDFNLRFHWSRVVGDDLYVVWNSGFTTDPAVPHRFPSPGALGHPLNGALIIKAVHRMAP